MVCVWYVTCTCLALVWRTWNFPCYRGGGGVLGMPEPGFTWGPGSHGIRSTPNPDPPPPPTPPRACKTARTVLWSTIRRALICKRLRCDLCRTTAAPPSHSEGGPTRRCLRCLRGPLPPRRAQRKWGKWGVAWGKTGGIVRSRSSSLPLAHRPGTPHWPITPPGPATARTLRPTTRRDRHSSPLCPTAAGAPGSARPQPTAHCPTASGTPRPLGRWPAAAGEPPGIRAHRHRTHQLTSTGVLESGGMGKMGKEGEMEKNEGNWGEVGK